MRFLRCARVGLGCACIGLWRDAECRQCTLSLLDDLGFATDFIRVTVRVCMCVCMRVCMRVRASVHLSVHVCAS